MNVMAFTNTRVFNLFAQRPTARLKGQTWKGNSLAFNGNVVLLRRTLYLRRKRQRVSACEGQFKDSLIVGPLSGFQVHRNAATEQKVVATEDLHAGELALWVKAQHYGALGAYLPLGVAWGSSNGSEGIAFACQHPKVDWQPYFFTLSTI